MVFSNLYDISETKFRKAKADQLLKVNETQAKLKTILKRNVDVDNFRNYV